MFDEPVNGLDPEGILWIRTLMRSLAAEGRTVFVSSHLMSEMENTADHLIVIGRGRLIADCSMAEFIARGTGQAVLVRTPQPDGLARAVTAAGGTVAPIGQGDLEVRGLPPGRIGDLALASGIALHHLAPARASLEEAFMELTADSVEYPAGGRRAGGQPATERRHDMAAITAGPAVRRRPGPGAPGRPGRGAPLRVHQAALGPVHLLVAAAAGAGGHRLVRGQLRGCGRALGADAARAAGLLRRRPRTA